jgi:hypothetical protein
MLLDGLQKLKYECESSRNKNGKTLRKYYNKIIE